MIRDFTAFSSSMRGDAVAALAYLLASTLLYSGDSPNKEIVATPVQKTKIAPPPVDPVAEINAMAKELDEIEKEIEEWGHASATSLILMDPGTVLKDPRGITHVDFNENYSAIAANLGVQGGVRVARAQGTSIGLSGGIGRDSLAGSQEKLAARNNEIALEQLNIANTYNKQILGQRGEKLLEHERNSNLTFASSNGEGDGTEVASGNVIAPEFLEGPEDVDALASGNLSRTRAPEIKDTEKLIAALGGAFERGVALGGNATGLGGNVTGATEPRIAASDRVKIAISTVLGGKVADFFSDPVGLAGGKKVYIAMGQVSVTPGWRTKEHYACEIQLFPQYARNIPNCPDDVETSFNPGNNAAQPMMSAAFPMAEAQILALDFNQTEQFKFLLQLAADMLQAGQRVNARAVFNFAKTMERQVTTRNAIPTVVPSSDGSQVTYRFNPSLQAVDVPFSKRGKPGLILNPISIPVMTVVVCDKDDLFDWNKLHVTSNVRWVPLEKQTLLSKMGSVVVNNRINDKRKTNVERVAIAKRVGECYKRIGILRDVEDQDGFPEWQFHEVYMRLRNLESLGIAFSTYADFPLPEPKIKSVTPNPIVARGEDVILKVSGEGFAPYFSRGWPDGDKEVLGFLNGVKLVAGTTGYPTFTSKKHHIEFCVPSEDLEQLVGATPGNVTFQMITPGGGASQPITVSKAPAKVTPPDPVMQISSVSHEEWNDTTDGEKTLVIRGSHFPKDEPLSVYLGPLVLGSTSVHRQASSLISVSVEVPKLPVGTYDLDLIAGEGGDGKHAFLKDAVQIKKRNVKASIAGITPVRGYRYSPTYVAIRGTGFQSVDGRDQVAMVNVAGKECFFRTVSPEMIIAVVPPIANSAEDDKDPKAFIKGDEKATLMLVLGDEVLKSDRAVMQFDILTPQSEMSSVNGDYWKQQNELRAKIKEAPVAMSDSASEDVVNVNVKVNL